MNTFAEWAAFSVLIVTVGVVVVLLVKRPMWKAAQRASELAYTERQRYVEAFDQLRVATDQAIAVIRMDYPDFPADVRDQLFAAHDAANFVTTTRRHISASHNEG